jgi:DNA-binding LytR/AlgR family response regulator
MTSRPLRLLLVDDEPPARARLRRLLETIPGTEVAAEAGSVREALHALARTTPDAVLLDVQMPGGDGFSLLPHLPEGTAVVFTTAFDAFAVQAFEANAVDYLLKPFRAERLASAIERVREQRLRPAELARRLADLSAQLHGSAFLERLTVRLGLKQLLLRVDEVLWFGAEDKLVFAATAAQRHWINLTLDELERRLDPARFARVHRSAIAHLDHAVALKPAFAGTWRLVMDDPARTEVPVARARARALRQRFAG